MKAWVCHSYGEVPDLRFDEVSPPDPGPGEVRVAVRATGMTFVERLMCQGRYQLKPDLPFTPGNEASGIVAAVGPEVKDWKEGDNVSAARRTGVYAEEVCFPAAHIRPIPSGYSFAEAACYRSGLQTAYVALVLRGRLRKGETVLVLGAAGGVGLAAVELAAHLGAEVIAVVGRAPKAAPVSAKGAAHVLVAPEDLRAEVKALTGDRGVDVVYDPVGGDMFTPALRCLAIFGRYLVVGFAGGHIPEVAVNYPLIKQLEIIGVRAGEYERQRPDAAPAINTALWDLADGGAVRPHIHAILPAAQLPAAFAMIAARDVVGRLVLQWPE